MHGKSCAQHVHSLLTSFSFSLSLVVFLFRSKYIQKRCALDASSEKWICSVFNGCPHTFVFCTFCFYCNYEVFKMFLYSNLMFHNFNVIFEILILFIHITVYVCISFHSVFYKYSRNGIFDKQIFSDVLNYIEKKKLGTEWSSIWACFVFHSM